MSKLVFGTVFIEVGQDRNCLICFCLRKDVHTMHARRYFKLVFVIVIFHFCLSLAVVNAHYYSESGFGWWWHCYDNGESECNWKVTQCTSIGCCNGRGAVGTHIYNCGHEHDCYYYSTSGYWSWKEWTWEDREGEVVCCGVPGGC